VVAGVSSSGGKLPVKNRYKKTSFPSRCFVPARIANSNDHEPKSRKVGRHSTARDGKPLSKSTGSRRKKTEYGSTSKNADRAATALDQELKSLSHNRKFVG